MFFTALSGAMKANLQRKAGKITEAQSEIDASAEADDAKQREINRKKLLLRAISSQQAAAGAAGVAFSEGSPARIAQLDIEQATDDLFIDRAGSLQRQRGLRSQGRAARQLGKTQSNVTLLDTAVKVATLAGK